MGELMTTIIFCADPLRRRQPDPIYAAEYAAAQAAGFTVALLDYEALVDEHDAVASTRQIAAGSGDAHGIYRGWMLTPSLYHQLYDALMARGMTLINTPEMYRHTHYLPESYPVIQAHTPRTVWLRGADVALDDIMLALAPFGDAPLILKDFVKSRKHEWYEACYIPSASDRVAVERVVRRFVALQGDALNERLVFRAFVPLVPLATHSKSAMPLAQEFRRFWLDGEPLATAAYWDEGEYNSTQPPDDLFATVARQVQSRFFTMDVARTLDGEWIIIELGDGQVAGMPEHLDVTTWYGALATALATP